MEKKKENELVTEFISMVGDFDGQCKATYDKYKNKPEIKESVIKILIGKFITDVNKRFTKDELKIITTTWNKFSFVIKVVMGINSSASDFIDESLKLVNSFNDANLSTKNTDVVSVIIDDTDNWKKTDGLQNRSMAAEVDGHLVSIIEWSKKSQYGNKFECYGDEYFFDDVRRFDTLLECSEFVGRKIGEKLGKNVALMVKKEKNVGFEPLDKTGVVN